MTPRGMALTIIFVVLFVTNLIAQRIAPIHDGDTPYRRYVYPTAVRLLIFAVLFGAFIVVPAVLIR